jgi:hypothetical protein
LGYLILSLYKKMQRVELKNLSEEARMFFFEFRSHETLRFIGQKKPVGTSHSGVQRKDYSMWEAVPDKELLIKWFQRYYGYTLRVYVNHKGAQGNNTILYFSLEHLSALACSVGVSLDILLDILANVEQRSPTTMQWIYIAFGDKFKQKDMYGQLELSEQGEDILQKYLSSSAERYFDENGGKLETASCEAASGGGGEKLGGGRTFYIFPF